MKDGKKKKAQGILKENENIKKAGKKLDKN